MEDSYTTSLDLDNLEGRNLPGSVIAEVDSRDLNTRRADALYKLSQSIEESGNHLSKILDIVASQSSESIGDACIVTLLVSDDRLKTAALHHADPEVLDLLQRNMLDYEFKMEQSIISKVILSGEPVLIPFVIPGQVELISRSDFEKLFEIVGIESVLIVPIKGQHNVLGTILLTRDQGGLAYTSQDQTFLMDIARRTALAIENCYLFDSLRQEIEERLEAEKTLSAAEERFRSIYESSVLGILLLDLDTRVLQANPAFQKMVGQGQAELKGRVLQELMPAADASAGLRMFSQLIEGQPVDPTIERRFIRQDGEMVWAKATFAGVKDQGGEHFNFFVVMVEDITERKNTELELAEMKARFLTNVEVERLRLAQELHDGAMQDLHSVIFQIQGLRQKTKREIINGLFGIRNNVQEVIQELRTIAKELRPPTIARFGLEKAIRSHAVDFTEKNPRIEVKLALDADFQLLPEEVRLVLFRIYQQAMINVIRHAEASSIEVRFKLDAEEARLEIEDNGRGFVAPVRWITFVRQGHYGLAGIAEKVASLNGTFELISQPGSGTQVRVVIPRTVVG